MKSIKPGRGPSKMSAAGSIFAAVFGVFWCIVAASIGAYIMIPFGVIFIGFAVWQAVYHTHNATSEDRYSVFDIVDSEEEIDPLQQRYGRNTYAIAADTPERGGETEFCPYCGKPVGSDFEFCPKCGKRLPE